MAGAFHLRAAEQAGDLGHAGHLALSYDLPPYVRGSDTSEAAAARITSDAVALRFRVFEHVRSHGSTGATCWEVERDLSMRHQTASARIRELVLLGALADSKLRRNTGSGRKAAVWVVASLIWKNDGMYWLAKCPLCGVTHETAADNQPAATQCRHPLHSERAFPRPGELAWSPGGEDPPQQLTIRHPPPSLPEWPEAAEACELADCADRRLRGIPICRRHAAMVPFHLVRDVFIALESPRQVTYSRAHANLLRYVADVREVLDE